MISYKGASGGLSGSAVADIVIVALLLRTAVDLILWWSSDRGLLEYCHYLGLR